MADVRSTAEVASNSSADNEPLTKEERYRLARARIFRDADNQQGDTTNDANPQPTSTKARRKPGPDRLDVLDYARHPQYSNSSYDTNSLRQTLPAIPPPASSGGISATAAPFNPGRTRLHVAATVDRDTRQDDLEYRRETEGAMPPTQALPPGLLHHRTAPELWQVPTDRPAPLSMANLAALEASFSSSAGDASSSKGPSPQPAHASLATNRADNAASPAAADATVPRNAAGSGEAAINPTRRRQAHAQPQARHSRATPPAILQRGDRAATAEFSARAGRSAQDNPTRPSVQQQQNNQQPATTTTTTTAYRWSPTEGKSILPKSILERR